MKCDVNLFTVLTLFFSFAKSIDHWYRRERRLLYLAGILISLNAILFLVNNFNDTLAASAY